MEIPYSILSKLRENPGMYLGKKSLLDLHQFLSGYLYRQWEIYPEYKTSFGNFTSYVKNHYNFEPNTIGWAYIISRFELDDEKAFDKFFELLEEFIEENYPELISKTSE